MKNSMKMKHILYTCILLVFVIILDGCISMAPEYRVPAMDIPLNFKEAAPWVDAKPADSIPRGSWWNIYGDPMLSKLETQLDMANPNLAAALDHYAQEKAYDDQIRAGLLPTVSGGVNVSNNRQSDTRPLRGSNQPDIYGSQTLGINADYELDLWGKVRNEVAASEAETAAAADDLASAKLSLEVRLAQDYISILGADREIQLLTDTANAYAKALTLTETLHTGGLVSGLDTSRAAIQLDTAKAQVFESQAKRALLEHSIAVLVGQAPSSFSLKPDMHTLNIPSLPIAVPAALLQRRPDIAAAERRAAAANASIGVARAAFFPNIDLSAGIGLQSVSLANWFSLPSIFWTLGGTLTQLIFDGGMHDAKLAQAKDKLSEAGDLYRVTVLNAFQKVEDNLALLQNYQEESKIEVEAVAKAQETVDLSMSFYKNGGVGYLDVIDSQTALLNSQRAELSLQTRQLLASAGLVDALGGGWAPEP